MGPAGISFEMEIKVSVRICEEKQNSKTDQIHANASFYLQEKKSFYLEFPEILLMYGQIWKLSRKNI